PLEFANRYLAQAIVNGAPIGYNLFAIGGETLIVVGFVALLRPQRADAFGAFCIGLGYLVGHHAFAAGLELNIAISNLLIALLTRGALLWIERGWGGSAAVVLLSVLAVATKEIGLVVPVMVLTAHLVGLRRLHPLALVLLIGGGTAYVGQ